jgi:hypothetical protein
VCVQEIAVVEEIDHPRAEEFGLTAGGRYRNGLGAPRIELVAGPSTDAIRATLVHELCHAASDQADLARGLEPLAVEDGLAAPSLQEEAFAQWCDQGQLAPTVLLASGALNPAEEEAVLGLQAHMWLPPPEATPLPFPDLIGTELDAGAPLAASPFTGFTEDGALVVATAAGDHVALDPVTGAATPAWAAEKPPPYPPDERLWDGLEGWDIELVGAWPTWEEVTLLAADATLPTGRRLVLTVVVGAGATPSVLRAEADPAHTVQLGFHRLGALYLITHHDAASAITVWSWSPPR